MRTRVVRFINARVGAFATGQQVGSIAIERFNVSKIKLLGVGYRSGCPMAAAVNRP